jgi:two-component system, NarL family, nitrate/nitrite response regulator NarL
MITTDEPAPSHRKFLNLDDDLPDRQRQSVRTARRPQGASMTATFVDRDERRRSATVMIVEDHALLADGLADALRLAGLRATRATDLSIDGIVEQARASRPDVVLLDLMLGEDSTLSLPAIKPLLEAGARVVILSGVVDRGLLGACIDAGAVDVVSKTESFDTVLERTRRVVAGARAIDPAKNEDLLRCFRRDQEQTHARLAPFARLTAREQAVLSALTDGLSAEQIAVDSFVSITTVRSQIRSILEKLGVRSQLSAVALAHRSGWSRCAAE